MALCSLKELLTWADKENLAVGSFSVGNMEMIMGAVKAAEEMNTPIILQIAEIRLKYAPLELIAPILLAAARSAKVDIAVHFDHGATPSLISEALDLGFTSVMFDGSKLQLRENIESTWQIVNQAQRFGASVEAELGVIGKDEAGNDCGKAIYTNPSDALLFANSVPIDALAVAIGNAHGHYEGKPQLRFDILEKINNSVDVPLVLHGGSGISGAEFRRCINLGVRKINIATASFDAYTSSAGEYSLHAEKPNFFGLSDSVVEGVYDNVKKHIKIFNNVGELI